MMMVVYYLRYRWIFSVYFGLSHLYSEIFIIFSIIMNISLILHKIFFCFKFVFVRSSFGLNKFTVLILLFNTLDVSRGLVLVAGLFFTHPGPLGPTLLNSPTRTLRT